VIKNILSGSEIIIILFSKNFSPYDQIVERRRFLLSATITKKKISNFKAKQELKIKKFDYSR